jgi:hypothetical protein
MVTAFSMNTGLKGESWDTFRLWFSRGPEIWTFFLLLLWTYRLNQAKVLNELRCSAHVFRYTRRGPCDNGFGPEEVPGHICAQMAPGTSNHFGHCLFDFQGYASGTPADFWLAEGYGDLLADARSVHHSGAWSDGWLVALVQSETDRIEYFIPESAFRYSTTEERIR